jgi:hypothetical protein
MAPCFERYHSRPSTTTERRLTRLSKGMSALHLLVYALHIQSFLFSNYRKIKTLLTPRDNAKKTKVKTKKKKPLILGKKKFIPVVIQ